MKDADTLNEQERELLAELLRREAEELGLEIHHTSSREYRQRLRDRRELVGRLLERLAVPAEA